MRHSWCIPLVLTFAAVAGYAAGSRPVQAQADTWPFSTGETVTFEFTDGGTRQCRVEEIKGGFARCGSLMERQGPTIGRREPPEDWVNIAVVEGMMRPRVRFR